MRDRSLIRLLFLIRNLEVGGAERQLTQLVRGLAGRSFCMTVVTLYDGGELLSEIQGLDGVRVVSLHKQHRWHLAPVLWKLVRVLREVRPHLIHGYMSGSNELCLLAGKVLAG